jgi:type I restriction enzyme S subunit
MYGATIGKLGILTFPATTNQACCACVNCVINKQFLFYFLLSHREEFIRMGGGGAQPNISKEKIESTIIPIPPMAEQERIVNAIHITLAKIDTIAANL